MIYSNMIIINVTDEKIYIYRNWNIPNICIVHNFVSVPLFLSVSLPLPIIWFFFFRNSLEFRYASLFSVLIFMIRKLYSGGLTQFGAKHLISSGMSTFPTTASKQREKRIKINDHWYESSNAESWSLFVCVVKVRIIHLLRFFLQAFFHTRIADECIECREIR